MNLAFFEPEKRRVLISVLKAAFPIFLNLESFALIGIVDLELAGRLSASAQAAVGLGDQLLFLTSTAAWGLSVATCAVAARYFGAGNTKRMMTTIKSSLIVATISGVAAMLAGLLAADCFVQILSSDPEVIAYGVRYIQLCAIGSLPYVMSIVVASIFRAIGKTAESLYLALTTSVVSIALSYVFFLSPGPLHASLDALCAAWIVGAYVGLGVGFFVLWRRMKNLDELASVNSESERVSNERASVKNVENAYRSDKRHVLRLVKLLLLIGSAVVLADSSTLASDFLVYKLLAAHADATSMQAAWTIFLKVEETFAIMPISALSLAFAATVGHMIGQGKEEEARKCLSILLVGTTVLLTIQGAALLAAPQLMAFFSHAGGAVLENTEQLIILVPVFFPLLAMRLLVFSFMEGSGQTSTPMKLALAGNAIKLAVGMLLLNVMSSGVVGLTVALLVSRIFLAAGSMLAFKTRANRHHDTQRKSEPARRMELLPGN